MGMSNRHIHPLFRAVLNSFAEPRPVALDILTYVFDHSVTIARCTDPEGWGEVANCSCGWTAPLGLTRRQLENAVEEHEQTGEAECACCAETRPVFATVDRAPVCSPACLAAFQPPEVA